MSVTTWFTRGGQLALHRLRMVAQVMSILLSIGLCGGLALSGWMLYTKIPPAYWQSAQDAWMAEFLLQTSFGSPHDVVQEIQRGSQKQQIRSVDVLRHPLIKKRTRWVETFIKHALWKGFQTFLWTLGLGSFFFLLRGSLQSRKKVSRGRTLVTPQSLARRLRFRFQASDLALGKVPLLKNKETQHFLITGTTGSGKSNCLNTLLPQIQERPNRAIIVDLTGDLINRYYRPEQDLIINPFEEESQKWLPWNDCQDVFQVEALAQAIIPPAPSHTDPFWRQAAKDILAAALKKFSHERDSQQLYNLLVKAPLEEFSQAFEGTEAATYTQQEGEKMTLSIRATLVNNVQSLQYLQKGDFSFRQWVQEDTNSHQWLFLTAKPDQRATLIPLIRGQLDP